MRTLRARETVRGQERLARQRIGKTIGERVIRIEKALSLAESFSFAFLL
jgi:hypothetical protein